MPEKYATKEDILELAYSQRILYERINHMITNFEAASNFIAEMYRILPAEQILKVQKAYKEKYGREFLINR